MSAMHVPQPSQGPETAIPLVLTSGTMDSLKDHARGAAQECNGHNHVTQVRVAELHVCKVLTSLLLLHRRL